MSKIKLTKITIETKSKDTIDLSIKEAKELYDQLHELFGSKTVYIPKIPDSIFIERNKWAKPYKPTYYNTYYTPNLNEVTCELSGFDSKVKFIGSESK